MAMTVGNNSKAIMKMCPQALAADVVIYMYCRGWPIGALPGGPFTRRYSGGMLGGAGPPRKCDDGMPPGCLQGRWI
jgi:hypothetical protein